MAIFKRWIIDVFLCLLLPLFMSASDGYEDDVSCTDNSSIRTSQYMTYYGCYNLSCFVAGTNSSVNDIDQCTEQCKNGSHSYAALFNGDWCSCGKLICGRADMVCDFKCAFPCNVILGDVFQTCGGRAFFQVYRDETSDGTLDGNSDENSDLIATLMKATIIVIVVIIIVGVLMICCTWILQAVRNLARAASPGPSSQADNQPADVEYAEIGPADLKTEATPDPFLDLNMKQERSGSDEYHEYADANNLTRPVSALRIGKDGYLVPE